MQNLVPCYIRYLIKETKSDSTYRLDGPSPTIVSNIAPQNVRCGGKIARGNLPGVAFPKQALFREALLCENTRWRTI